MEGDEADEEEAAPAAADKDDSEASDVEQEAAPRAAITGKL